MPKVDRWGCQWGGAVFLPWGVGRLPPFAGWDLQWRGEAPSRPSFNSRLGIALNNPTQAYRSFRFFYSFYAGQDLRGQFFQNSVSLHSLGIEMQI